MSTEVANSELQIVDIKHQGGVLLIYKCEA